MNILNKVCLIVFFGAFCVSCDHQFSVGVDSLETELDSVSYALGLDIAKNVNANFGKSGIKIDSDLLVQGIVDANDSLIETLIDPDLASGVITTYIQNMRQRDMEDEAMKKYADVKEKGEAFLAENKKKEGVMTTDSGLQYQVLKEGKKDGKSPSATDQVKVHYHGTTPDGEVFDSSVDRGEPITFGLDQVIKGWTEGVQLMKEGAKFKFFIPQELAYGNNGGSERGKIKPFMPLVFEVELLEVVKPDKPATTE